MRKTILFVVVCVCMFICVYVAKNLIRYFDQQQVIYYLKSEKYNPSDYPPAIQTNSMIDSQIRKIRETQTYRFPMICSATVEKFYKEIGFDVTVEWFQKKSNSCEFKEMFVLFEYEDKKKKYKLDVIGSGIAEECSDPFYIDEFFVRFFADPNNVDENFSYLLPCEYFEGSVHVSLTDSEGNSTEWIKCEIVDRFADLREDK